MELEAPLRVTDPEMLRAFAHPLRLRILSEISQVGRSNVVGIAERVGEPANSVSYHLSILARHGLVVPAEPPAGATKRERWWQTASASGFAVDEMDDEIRPAVTEALVAWTQHRAGEVVRRIMASDEEAAERDLPALQSGMGMWLAPEEARQVRADLREVGRRLTQRYLEQRAAGHLAEGPGEGTDFYLFDLTFFADLSGQPTLRGWMNTGEEQAGE